MTVTSNPNPSLHEPSLLSCQAALCLEFACRFAPDVGLTIVYLSGFFVAARGIWLLAQGASYASVSSDSNRQFLPEWRVWQMPFMQPCSQRTGYLRLPQQKGRLE
jgi:hypothetical protein